jgi:hypothetical protein
MTCLDNFEQILLLEIFFIRLLVFSLKGFENPQNRIFSKKTDFFKKSNFEDFSSPFREKTKSLNEKHFQDKCSKLSKKSHFSYLKVGETTSRWIFWRKSKNQNFAFLKILKCFFFKIACVSAWFFCWFFNL